MHYGANSKKKRGKVGTGGFVALTVGSCRKKRRKQGRRGDRRRHDEDQEIAEWSKSGVINTHSHAVARIPFPWGPTPAHVQPVCCYSVVGIYSEAVPYRTSAERSHVLHPTPSQRQRNRSPKLRSSRIVSKSSRASIVGNPNYHQLNLRRTLKEDI